MRIYIFFPILPDLILFRVLDTFFSALYNTFILSYSSENNKLNESIRIILINGYFCNIPGIEFKITNKSSRSKASKILHLSNKFS